MISEDRQTVSGAFAKIESHEELCAERYATIHSAIGDIKGLLKWCAASAAAAAAAVIWALLQFNFQASTARITANAARITELEQRPPVTVVQSQGQH
jgi:hypothetical protein